MLTIKKPTTKEVSVEVFRFVWRKPMTVPPLIERCRCSVCKKKIGTRRWGIAWIREAKNEKRSMRLCEACGMKAEEALA